MIAARIWPWVALALAAAVGLQEIRVRGLEVDLAKLEASQAKMAQTQAQQAQAATENKAAALLDHADNMQTNVYEYTQKITQLEAGRARDAADIASLQQQLRTTATQRAQAAADAAAARDLADHYQRLAAHLAEGAGVVGELVGLVERRDAQVDLLKQQVLTERALVGRLLSRTDEIQTTK